MKLSALHWAAALTFSLAVHLAAAAALLGGSEEFIEQSGGGDSIVIVIGEDYATMLAAGALTPTPPSSAAALPVVQATENPVRPVLEAQPLQRAEAETAETADASTARIVEAATEPPAAVETAALTPSEVLEPADAPATITATEPIVVPVPTPRPERPTTAAKRQSAPKQTTAARPERRQQQTQHARRATASQQSGAQGNARQTAHLGASAAPSARQQRAGNAAVDSYPGRVARALRRARHYPREARRAGVQGEARVRFVVQGNGAATGIRIARSSGSPALDAAAIETVRRAAPFPPIPKQAGRSSWTFTVPVNFRR